MNSKTFDGKSISLTISTLPTPKLPSVFMWIKINTSEKDLLYSLSLKYKKEKLLSYGSQANNNAYSFIPGVNGIIINCPENKITNNILQYISYLKKTSLKDCQFYSKSTGNYSTLMKDINKVQIKIIGKCKTFTKNCILVKEKVPKIEKLLQSIDSITPVKRENIKNDKFEECEKISIKASDGNVIDAFVILGNCCCGFRTTPSGFECCKCCCCCCADFQDTFRSQLKAFRNQFGSIGAKIDKTKCSYVIELGKMFSGVKGVEKVMKTDDVAKIDTESIKIIKDVIKQCK